MACSRAAMRSIARYSAVSPVEVDGGKLSRISTAMACEPGVLRAGFEHAGVVAGQPAGGVDAAGVDVAGTGGEVDAVFLSQDEFGLVQAHDAAAQRQVGVGLGAVVVDGGGADLGLSGLEGF